MADAIRQQDSNPGGTPADLEMFVLVGDLLRAPGVAVARTTSNWGPKQRDVLILDPTTSRLLAEERILLERANHLDAALPVPAHGKDGDPE